MNPAMAKDGDVGLGYDFVVELKGVRTALLRYAQRLTGNEAARDDLIQDTLLRAWAARDQFSAGTSFKAWLFRIARNSFLSGLRRRKREVDLPDEEFARLLTTPATQETGLHMQDLSRAVSQLPPVQAEALRALNGSQDGYDEVAIGLGIPTGTLRARVHRARKAIAHVIAYPASPKSMSVSLSQTVADDRSGSNPRSGVYAAWKASGSRMIG